MNDRSKNRVIVRRLKAGVDFKTSLDEIVKEEQIKAGLLLSVVGSFTQARFRMPSGEVRELSEPLEVVSGTGTVCSAGMHVHMSVSTEEGIVFGGHLVSGCLVRTTLELAIQDLSDQMSFDRLLDETTGYNELSVHPVSE